MWWRRGRSRGIASEQGLKSGDVIFELGDLKVATPEEVRKAMGEAQKEMANMPRGGTLLMQMRPDNMIKFVAIPLAGA